MTASTLPPAPRVVISHASEDRARFVEPLAHKLRADRVDAWVSFWEMGRGDRLPDKVFEVGLGEADVRSRGPVGRRCLAETEEQAEDLLATLDMVGNLLRLTPYYEGVACHPLLPNLIIMESAVTHERPPATCGSILDFAEPEDFLHTSLITDVDPARRDRAVRRLQAILNRKPVDGRRAGDPSAAAAYDRS
ncbi:MAG: toll/interleukin-1 receptor domain-containing protein [Gemmatimonas sp.]